MAPHINKGKKMSKTKDWMEENTVDQKDASEKIITARWLDKHNACFSGMSWFASRFPDGGKISDVLVLIVCEPAAEGSWVSWLMTRAKYTEVEWITSLSEGLNVGGSLYLRGTGIKKKDIPKQLLNKAIF